jgi:outer membrane protein assembly factor BamB
LSGLGFRPWAKALFDQNTANNMIDNPESRCLPRGVPKADAFDLHKIIQTPELIVILYEYQTTYRQIFMDDRALPQNPNPTWAGYSAGHWEGDTLVVESNGFNGKAWLSGFGNPTTDAMHLTERMRRRDPPRSVVANLQGTAVNQRKEEEGYGAVRAIDPKTGEKKWEFKMLDVTDAGILTTASDVLFSGGREGYFYALDGRSGELLWKANVGGAVASGPMSYSVNGRQYVAVSAGNSLLVYALNQ